jgi:hypothetical protein
MTVLALVNPTIADRAVTRVRSLWAAARDGRQIHDDLEVELNAARGLQPVEFWGTHYPGHSR